MRNFLFFLIVLILAVWAGIKIAADPGYALFVYRHWSVEMPLWLCFVIVLVGFFVFYYAVRALLGLGYYHHEFNGWLGAREKHKAHVSMANGFIELIEGDAKKAERYALQQVKRSDIPLINYLTAARAAHFQEAYERRDDYLRLARNADPSANIAVGLTQVHLYLKQKQFEQALAVLKQMKTVSGRHPRILKYLSQVYWALQDWPSLRKLLPDLKKKAVFSASKLSELDSRVHINNMTSVADNELETAWHEFSREMKHCPSVIAAYAKRLVGANKAEVAQKLLRDRLKKSWDESLIVLYGEIAPDAESQLKLALRWLKQHPQSPGLCAAIAALSVKESLWGQAREYYDKSLALSDSVEVKLAYAEFLEQHGEPELALSIYKKVCRET